MPAVNGNHSNGIDSTRIDEDEAALYDRQIRLWGVEAQNRMKTASVLIVNLRGLASEVCKNIVLAGIGKLTLVDESDVTEQDLGTGYFFRDADVGKKRVHAAQARIQALNPRVQVTATTDLSLLEDERELAKFDLVCVTDSTPTKIIHLNDLCRKINVKLYAAASVGLSGYIFADLLEHQFTMQRTDPKAPVEPGVDVPKVTVKKQQSFVPFSKALKHSWKSSKPPIRPKRLPKMIAVFEILALLEYQIQHQDSLPADSDDLKQLMQSLINGEGFDSTKLIDPSRLQFLTATASTEFSPVCAIIGGVLGQDILNTLGGREVPLSNFFVWDGDLNTGDIYALNVDRV